MESFNVRITLLRCSDASPRQAFGLLERVCTILNKIIRRQQKPTINLLYIKGGKRCCSSIAWPMLFWVGMQYENVQCSYFGCGRNKLNVNFRLRSKISEGGNPKGRIARAKMLAALNYHIAAALVAVILKNFSIHFEALKHEKFAFTKVM